MAKNVMLSTDVGYATKPKADFAAVEKELGVKKKVQGTNERLDFSRIPEKLQMPNLIDIQKSSYKWFVEEGIKEVFEDLTSITDYSQNLVLQFLDYHFEDETKYSITECKIRDATYARPLKVKVRLINNETGEVKDQELFMGDFPLMTDSGTFIINGAERVVVSQLVRSPGMYFDKMTDKQAIDLFTTQIIPNRGAWIEYETDANNVFWARIDKTRKIPVTTLLRALSPEVGTNEQIKAIFGEDEMLLATLEKDPANSTDSALIEIYKKLRPGEPPTVESAQTLVGNLFFDPHRYDLSKVGRFKYDKKMALGERIKFKKLAQPVVAPLTGELIADAGERITADKALEIENCGANVVYLDIDGHSVKVFANGTVDIQNFVNFNAAEALGIKEKVNFKVLSEILAKCESDEDIIAACRERSAQLVANTITVDDVFASVNYVLCMTKGIGTKDDIDHLGNRRIRSVGELLQNQFRIGLSRMERVIRERMTIQDLDVVTPQALINIRPVVAAIKEFFGSSPLSQFMDQTNPLAELTHKRRLSALGPGGLSRDRASFEVRDVHHSHYGRMCPIETPEGPNIGLISYLATFARINDYGFIEAPYRRVDKESGTVTDEIVYMTADIEDNYVVAQASEPLDEQDRFVNDRITVRSRDEFLEVEKHKVDFVDVSPRMIVSVATSMIPFLQNDDANRALMGSNMQRQAVPLLRPDSPIVATGIEYRAAYDSGVVVLSKKAGTVVKTAADKIVIRNDDGTVDEYELIKFLRSNQGTCINQRPIVENGQHVEAGAVIADGPATDNGEIALGRNALIGFMNWEGYNYEDAVLLNEKIVREDMYTSIHIEEFETEARETKLGDEIITREIPGVGEDMLKDLDERGIIRVGAEVHAGDILVGKITPKGETEQTAEEKLLRAIFGDKAKDYRDTSLKVPHGEYGIIVDVKVFTRKNCDELSPGVKQVVRCYIAQKRKISVGDKMAGRHGNKGVVARILRREDMPYLEDGTALDIVLNPLGVPSRMNIGQVLEVHLGMAAARLGFKIMTPVFDGARHSDIEAMLDRAGMSKNGKSVVYDGRTGEKFDNPVTVGYMYYLKLHHLVDDKIHARSIGPYSLVTQQPLGGKAQFGGQRFGEMEVWALEAYGAAYTLQEILTVKSDDVTGRSKTYESIVKGLNVPQPGIPESFKVLIKELQSLGLDIKVLDKNNEEIEIKELPDEDDIGFGRTPVEELTADVYEESELAEGFGEEGIEDDDETAETENFGDDADDDFDM